MNRALTGIGQSSFQAQDHPSAFSRSQRLTVVRDEPLGENQGLDLLVSTVAERVATLVRQDRLREARAVLQGARSASLGGSRLEMLEQLFEVVAKPVPTPSHGPTPARRFESARYRGRWVALVGTTVVESATTLEALRLRVKDDGQVVLHWVAP